MAVTGGTREEFDQSRGARTTTFLFADMEGSTLLLRRLGDGYPGMLGRYREHLRAAVADAGGWEVDVEGDGLFAAFASARDAVAAAIAGQRRLSNSSWPDDVDVRARMGLHTGEAEIGPQGYVGLDVHRAARIAAAAHGGQVLLSGATRTLVDQHLPDSVALRDLGSHRLKDLPEPERLYQVLAPGLAEHFPPPRTLDAVPNNLPERLSSFVGRQWDVERAVALLQSTRLLTLTGPGGTGKTRLALKVAATVVDRFPDGVWFVPLASLRDPELVPAAVLTALGLREASGRASAEQLADQLADKRVLLVLDNFEQLLPAAPRVAELLAAAGGVTALVTSRAPLHLSGEQELAVSPLSVPDPDHLPAVASLSQYDAVALFIQRASAALPDFAVSNDNAPAVAQICARLDGLPLAIELAAARVKLLPPEAMLARLERRLDVLGSGARDLPARQRTLRSTIAWSHELLGDDARRVFARLAVFVGGCTLEHAELVCGGDLDVLEALAELLDHSLVRQREVAGGVRYGMLETIRDFGLERLEESGESAALRRRHARCFLDLAEQAAGELLGPRRGSWHESLEPELGNFRSALAELLRTRDTPAALRMVGALWRFWQVRHGNEGLARVREVLALPEVEEFPEELSVALEAEGGLAYWAGDVRAARAPWERALQIERRLGRPRGVANAAYNLSFGGLTVDELVSQNWDLLTESLQLYTEAGDPAGICKAQWGMGVNRWLAGELDTAESHLSDALERARAISDEFHLGWSHHMLGTVYVRRGEADRARPHLDEAVRLFSAAGDHTAVTLLLDDYAALAELRQQPERQARLTAAARRLSQATGSELSAVMNRWLGRSILAAEEFQTAWAEGWAMDLDQAVAYALADD